MNITLVSPKQYIAQATELVSNATTRVNVLSMVIADHQHTAEFIDALEAAARRGVEVYVTADIFTYGEVNGSFLPLQYYSTGARKSTSMAKSFKNAGVHFRWIGHGRLTILNGRTHNKWCVVDDTVFTFGGVNLYQEGIEHTDYMLRTTNAALADRLVVEQRKIERAERRVTNYKSTLFQTEHGVVLFDGGIMGRSLIYQRSCELAKDAKEILYVSQYCPTGKLGRIITTKKARVYFNRPEQANVINRLLIRISMATSNLQTAYTRKKYLHAKFIIFTLKDGTKQAITGSHNFAYTGVLLGTREVALETKDPAVIAQLESFYSKHVS